MGTEEEHHYEILDGKKIRGKNDLIS